MAESRDWPLKGTLKEQSWPLRKTYLPIPRKAHEPIRVYVLVARTLSD